MGSSDKHHCIQCYFILYKKSVITERKYIYYSIEKLFGFNNQYDSTQKDICGGIVEQYCEVNQFRKS